LEQVFGKPFPNQILLKTLRSLSSGSKSRQIGSRREYWKAEVNGLLQLQQMVMQVIHG
jgi:hypothetical protein